MKNQTQDTKHRLKCLVNNGESKRIIQAINRTDKEISAVQTWIDIYLDNTCKAVLDES